MSFFNFDGGNEGDDSDNDLDLDAYDDTGLLAYYALILKTNHTTQHVPLPIPCEAHIELSQSVLTPQSQGRGSHRTAS
jgi:hypothetical protein